MGAILVMLVALSAEPIPVIAGPRQAAALAAADVLSVPPEDQCFQMYAFFTDRNDRLKMAGNTWAVNSAVSHASTIIKPVPCGNGFLLRWDIRKLLPQEKDFKRFVRLRETVLPAIEPDFHKAELIVDVNGRFFQKQQCSPYKVGGTTFTYKTIAIRPEDQFALGSNIEALLLLHSLTRSNVPIVRAEWFNNLITSTLALGGRNAKGLYYEFVGVKGLNEAQVFELFGADVKRLEERRADERAAMFYSKVSGRQRRIDVFPTAGARLSAAFNMGAVTHDIDIKDVNPDQDPLRNLIEFNDSAREGFFIRANGTQFAYLANDKGVLQDSGPEGTVHDDTVPHPHPQTLQPIISCFGCHGPKDGWIPFSNDVAKLLSFRLDGKTGNVFDDFAGKGSREEVLDRLAGLYSGDLREPIRLAQDALSKTCLNATGMELPAVTGSLVSDRNVYVFGRINAQAALRDQGFQVDEAEMTKRFIELCPPLPKFDGRSRPEDPSVLALYAGLDLSRAQYDHVKPDIALRIVTQLKTKRLQEAGK